jgi:hypothetical protein
VLRTDGCAVADRLSVVFVFDSKQSRVTRTALVTSGLMILLFCEYRWRNGFCLSLASRDESRQECYCPEQIRQGDPSAFTLTKPQLMTVRHVRSLTGI